jgi:lysophospholipase L1-like esterase
VIGNLVLGLISVVFAVAMIEIGLRIANQFGPAGGEPDPAAQIFKASANPDVVFEHVPNTQATYPPVFGNPSWFASIDENGIRRNGETQAHPAQTRGICLGDSTMFGAGLSDDETIPARLSDAVSLQIGKRFECLNFGVSNYTTAQEVAAFHHKRGLRFEPAVVVLGLYTNDFKTQPGSMIISGGKTQLVAPGASTGFFVRFSHYRVVAMLGSAVALFRKQMREIGLRPRANEKPLRARQIASVEGAIDRLREDLDAKGVPLLIVMFPRDWQLGEGDQVAASPRQQWAKGYCDQNQIACIDLLDHYFGKPIDAYFRYEDDSHPHAKAAAEIAAILAPDVAGLLEIENEN